MHDNTHSFLFPCCSFSFLSLSQTWWKQVMKYGPKFGCSVEAGQVWVFILHFLKVHHRMLSFSLAALFFKQEEGNILTLNGKIWLTNFVVYFSDNLCCFDLSYFKGFNQYQKNSFSFTYIHSDCCSYWFNAVLNLEVWTKRFLIQNNLICNKVDV